MLRVPAPAKINLYLHVGAKRADGYHALESLVCFAEAGDVLCVEAGEDLTLRLDGPFAAGLANEPDNLILRAARAYAAKIGEPARCAITLTKNLPVSSGIGGGSADAAAALRAMAKLLGPVPEDEMQALALSLGSDVPVCVKSVPAIMSGRGEILQPVAGLPQAPMLLVNPGVAVPTGEVFRRLGRTGNDGLPPSPPLPAVMTLASLIEYLTATRNDMEAAACAIAPSIGMVLDAMRAEGALLARMCGSGATCYALFKTDEACAAVAQSLALAHPDWWVQPTRIAAPEIAD